VTPETFTGTQPLAVLRLELLFAVVLAVRNHGHEEGRGPVRRPHGEPLVAGAGSPMDGEAVSCR